MKTSRTCHFFRDPMALVGIVGFLSAGLASPTTSHAADDQANAFFESKIRPVLVENCYKCHSLESGKAKGGLRLDDRDAIRVGGDSGPAVVIGKPAESLLLTAMQHGDPDLKMPPKKPKLSADILNDFESWITAGAIDPREAGSGQGDFLAKSISSRKNHWSYLPLQKSAIPSVADKNWPLAPVDFFILAGLESKGLSPSPDAESTILLRRLSFALTGLPPSPQQAARFASGDIEKVVDDMLASEGFGVRWARHWLDVARYAESNGKEANLTYPHAWRYRDYVIDAFNEDLPYDRFLTEQLAGDLIPAANDKQRARQLIATGFLAMGPKGLTEGNRLQFVADIVDEQIDVFSRSMLASSLACARCHDHKSDPVSMKDYYALAGIFKSTETRFGTWIDSESSQGSKLVTLPSLPGQLIPNASIPKREMEELHAKLVELEEQEKAGQEWVEKAQAEGRDLQKDFNKLLGDALRILWTRGPIHGKLNTVDDEGNALPLCMGVLEAEQMIDSPRYERGEISHPAEKVTRSVPAIFGIENEGAVPADKSGRLQLAQWVTATDNPLTARVMVNRIWIHLFGAGLVETVDNFGPTGTAPSHPELLDYLALRFQEDGWSIKSLIREIVLSRTFRQASDWRADCFDKDPDNRLLWRVSKQRLDAEVIRDSMLAASGELDLSPRPGSLVATLSSQSVGMVPMNKDLPDDLDGSMHRSIYLPVMRDQMPDILRHFDFAEPSLVTGKRDTTNVPSQALFLMNSEFVRARAEALARRVCAEASDRDARIERAYAYCFNRLPDEAETELVSAYLASASGSDTASGNDAGAAIDEAFVHFCQTLLATADFRIAD